MANLKAIRSRIGSVKNTKKITKAMNMVSAAKLRKNEQILLSLRPYADSLISLIQTLNTHVQSEHPFYKIREEGVPLYVFVTADKGLCGAFNSNIIKHALKIFAENKNAKAVVLGKKARDYFKRFEMPYEKAYVNIFNKPSYNVAKEIANWVADYYLSHEEISEVIFVFNRYKNSIVSLLTEEKFLPREKEEVEKESKIYLTEPDLNTALTKVMNEYLESEVYRIMLESLTSEHGARMAAMDSATENAEEMIKDLVLKANRERQAIITREIAEIVGGANAL